jgi:hypothetical protein
MALQYRLCRIRSESILSRVEPLCAKSGENDESLLRMDMMVVRGALT